MKILRKRVNKNRIKSSFQTLNYSQSDNCQLNTNLKENVYILQCEFGNSTDLIVRKLIIGSTRTIEAAVIYIAGFADKELVNEFITHSRFLTTEVSEFSEKERDENSYITNFFELMKEIALTTGSVSVDNRYDEIISALLDGNTIILFDSYQNALNISTTGGDYRAISEPTTQTAIKGAKESFIESVSSNIVMIRRRIKNAKLRIEKIKIGDISNTDVVITYIEGIAEEQLIFEVKQRLKKIDVNAMLESNHIEELIEFENLSPFPTVLNTERPDQLSRSLMAGKIAILVDGTPFALVVPGVFSDFFKVSDDYAQRFGISSLIRILRYIAFHFSIFSTPVYIAFTTFHQEIIPTNLLISFIAQREGVPYPAIIEALLLEFTFEILREAGIRIPRAIGPTISIAGALVIGEAAVSAGLVSPSMTIVVALTAISNFAIPSNTMADTTRILRFIFMFLASFSGIYGVVLGYLIMIAHLCSIRSFGIDYLSPFAPFYLKKQQDTILRFPFSLLDQNSKKTN